MQLVRPYSSSPRGFVSRWQGPRHSATDGRGCREMERKPGTDAQLLASPAHLCSAFLLRCYDYCCFPLEIVTSVRTWTTVFMKVNFKNMSKACAKQLRGGRIVFSTILQEQLDILRQKNQKTTDKQTKT